MITTITGFYLIKEYKKALTYKDIPDVLNSTLATTLKLEFMKRLLMC